MSEQFRGIKDEQWQEYLKLKEQVKEANKVIKSYIRNNPLEKYGPAEAYVNKWERKMTWEELKEKAKEMGYREFDFLGEGLEKEIRYTMAFYKNGDIEINTDYIIAQNRTPEQMLAIMKALQ